MVVKIFEHDGQRLKIFDQNLKPRFTRRENSTYNPIQRPWYLQALDSPRVIKTAPYMFSILKSPGVTYAQALEKGKRVVAVDISLEGMGKFLQKQHLLPGSEAFLFDCKGNLTAQVDEKSSSKQACTLKKLNFTDEELNFVLHNPIIRVSNEMDWPPFDFTLSGQSKGWATDAYLKKHYPNIKRIHVGNTLEALQLVEKGGADATLDSLPVLAYLKSSYFLKDILLSPEISDFSGKGNEGLHFLVQPKNTVLAGILDKALSSLTWEDLAPLQSKWLDSGNSDLKERESLITSAQVLHEELLNMSM